MKQNDIKSVNILYKYGFDGSGCHSIYNYKDNSEVKDTSSSDENYKESQLFTSFICPVFVKSTTNSKLIWYNPSPSSPVFCRPLRMQYKSETEHTVQQEHNIIKDQIENLINTKISNDIEIKHTFIQTMVDGKVNRLINKGTSTSVCYICEPPANPSNIKDIQNLLNKDFIQVKLSFGMAPLHLYINIMECVLHISYIIGHHLRIGQLGKDQKMKKMQKK